MMEPENNKVNDTSLEKVLGLYKKCDCYIMDRCCRYLPHARKNQKLKQIKYWTCDKFHGKKHKANCPCRPQSNPRLAKRLKKVNTSIAEQTFSWFRSHAKILNEARQRRHRFLVLYYSKKHNALIDQKKTSHLNKFTAAKAHPKRKSVAYPCPMKQAKAMKK